MKNLEQKKLSIIIVNYNSGDYLTKCLQSLSKIKSEINFDVWIVDNASADDSILNAQKKFPNYFYLKNENNLGFSKANNLALKRVKSEYILLLNPDSIIPSRTLKYMIQFMDENREVGAASCLVEKQDGSIDWASHRAFPTPLASFLYYFLKNDNLYHLTQLKMNDVHEVDAIAGAFFLTRKKVIEKVGYFDEDFFMYGEDLDLCFRIKKAGFKIMYVPQVKILHYKGISSGLKKHSQKVSAATDESREKALIAFYDAMRIFYKKHYEKKYLFFINWLVYMGINFKMLQAKRKLLV